MYQLRNTRAGEENIAMDIIDQAKIFLREQGIDQWQTGYPNLESILGDIEKENGYFIMEDERILGYICIDYAGEPAYRNLQGKWISADDAPYVVVHRLAFLKESRGKGLADAVFRLVVEQAIERGIHNFRVDTDADNKIMQHILQNNGLSYCGVIWFDNSEKIAFEKVF